MSVKAVKQCPLCKTEGKKTGQLSRVIQMECPKCGHQWSTMELKGRKYE